MFTNVTYLFSLLQDFNNYVGNLSRNAAKIINTAFQWKMNSKPGSNRFEQCEEVINLKTTSVGYPSILLMNNIAHHVPYQKYLAIVPFNSWLKLGENLKILSARIFKTKDLLRKLLSIITLPDKSFPVMIETLNLFSVTLP